MSGLIPVMLALQGFRWAQPASLWWLWGVPVLILVYSVSFYRKHVLLRRFAASDILVRINRNVSPARQWVKAGLLLLAFVFIVLGLTQPEWNPRPEKIKRKGRDIVILLDVSRSMLAQDQKPNRLEKAKLEISDLLDVLDGDRIGIVAFAGSAVVKCPLTQDYGFVRLVLAEITPDSVNRGGTLIGDAIRKATNEVFDRQGKDFKDIILITDGEDHDSFPVQAAEKAAQAGIRIFAIGLGDEKQGQPIPITGPNGEKTYLTYKGERVLSRLDGELLRKIVYATPGGKYLPVSTGSFELEDFYRRWIASAGKTQLQSSTVYRYEEKFQIFLAAALLLLLLEITISERRNDVKN